MDIAAEQDFETRIRWWLEKNVDDVVWWEHDATATVAEAKEVKDGLPDGHTKSLLLTDSSGTLVLFCLPGDVRADTKGLAASLGTSRLSFAEPELMQDVLSVSPGNLSPLALVADRRQRIDHTVIERSLMRHARIWVHPMRNTASVGIPPGAVPRFVADHGGTCVLLDGTERDRAD